MYIDLVECPFWVLALGFSLGKLLGLGLLALLLLAGSRVVLCSDRSCLPVLAREPRLGSLLLRWLVLIVRSGGFRADVNNFGTQGLILSFSELRVQVSLASVLIQSRL